MWLIFHEIFPILFRSYTIYCSRGRKSELESGDGYVKYIVIFINDIIYYIMRDNNNYSKSAADDWPYTRVI